MIIFSGGIVSKKYYAYFLEDENIKGLVDNWDKCKSLVHGKKARYKSFPTEKEGKDWLESGAHYEKKIGNQTPKIKKEKLKESLVNGIYFDSGTGRGIGVEVRVTDINGTSLLEKNSLGFSVNSYGNIHLGTDKTNNYGELLGLYLAMDIASQTGEKKIFGDSNLVIFFWSKGLFRKDFLTEDTISLILKVTEKRKNFEKTGGRIEYVSGDINPADLGFHK